MNREEERSPPAFVSVLDPAQIAAVGLRVDLRTAEPERPNDGVVARIPEAVSGSKRRSGPCGQSGSVPRGFTK
jgi:hypothetical protein